MFNLVSLIKTAGYAGITAIIFAESGLFFGFFLPGDSLLFTAGFLASQELLNIWILIALTFPAAVLGDQVGYTFGRKIGPKIFVRENSLLFHKDQLDRAKLFYETYGKKTIIIARFIPIVRTFAPILAGVGQMHYPTFLAYNVIGGILWAIFIPLIGYFLGSAIPGIDRYLWPIVAFIILTSFLPNLIRLLKDKEYRQRIAVFLRHKLLKK